MSKQEKKDKKDPFDGEYIGNIWGWRFSLISAVMIVGLTGLVVYRHYALDVPVGFADPLEEESEEVKPDSISEQDTLLDTRDEY